jgi:hypothetical protein
MNRRQPVKTVRRLAPEDFEEGLLDFFSYWAPLSGSNDDVVDLGNGHDLGGGAGQENLVCDIETFPRQYLLANFDVQFPGQHKNGMAGDAGQNGRAGWRREDNTILHHEHVLARPLRNITVMVQRNALIEPILNGFHLHQLGIQIVATRLRQGGKGIGSGSLPRRNANRDSFDQGFLAEVRPPGPRRDRALHRILERIKPHRAIAPEKEGTDITALELIDLYGFDDRVHELFFSVGNIHPVNFRGIVKTVDMGFQAENGRALFRGVASHTLENTRSIMNRVGQNVDVGFFPINHFPVEPDFTFSEHSGLLKRGYKVAVL